VRRREPYLGRLLCHCLLAGAGGVAVEVALTHAGQFFYFRPGPLGVAYWLPSLYMHAALLAEAVARVYFLPRR